MTMDAVSEPALQRVAAALGKVVGVAVKAIPRERWQESNHPSGEPVLLDEPFGPHLGVQGSPGYQFAVASAAPHAPEAGVHYIRTEETDGTRLWKVYSVVIIENLLTDSRWPAVMGLVGAEHAAASEEVARAHVFSYIHLRSDHHSPEVPPDIGRATPKGEKT